MSEAAAERRMVFRTGQARACGGALHWRRDCRYLKHARTVLEKPLDSFPLDQYQTCSNCWPEELPESCLP
jgi:hypothetical protein